jgi:PIN domain nuclease of toxin-antitoxin system
VRLLLDTHIFLWYITGDSRVGLETRRLIEDSEVAYLSVASVWEATIKYRIGKLPLPEPPHPWLVVQREQHGIESLPIDESAVTHLSQLESHHRDPFDRILVCQAIEHDLQIVTIDRIFSSYPAKLLRPA